MATIPKLSRLVASLPLQARYRATTTKMFSVRGVVVQQNLIAKQVVDYLHQQILDNPQKHQRYTHAEVGAALGIDPRKVHLGLAHSDYHGITVEVTPKCRAAIKRALRTANSTSVQVEG